MSAVIDIRQYLDPGCVPTLVLVDLQQRYAQGAGPFGVPHAAEAVALCSAALEHARAMGFPVAFVRRSPEGSVNRAGARHSRWIDGLQPWGSDMIFDRDKPSCYARNVLPRPCSTVAAISCWQGWPERPPVSPLSSTRFIAVTR